jgi:hypothetical protein
MNVHPRCDRVLYWSLWKERWTKVGTFGRTVLPLDQALKFIASEDILGYPIAAVQSPKMRKVELRSRRTSGANNRAATI